MLLACGVQNMSRRVFCNCIILWQPPGAFLSAPTPRYPPPCVQLGTGSVKKVKGGEDMQLTPQPSLVNGASVVACGAEFTTWLSQGKLWSAGLPQYGQLGHGEPELRSSQAPWAAALRLRTDWGRRTACHALLGGYSLAGSGARCAAAALAAEGAGMNLPSVLCFFLLQALTTSTTSPTPA